LEFLLEHLVQKLVLHVALHHVHPLLAELVDGLEDEILALVGSNRAGVNLADEVVKCYESARSANTGATYTMRKMVSVC
jgi:hypothetical protein